MAAEVVAALRPVTSGVILDATYGAGGHARSLLRELPDIEVLALDRDPVADDHAATTGPRLRLVRSNFADVAEVAAETGTRDLAGALFDLGVSSMQLDDPHRGFSYREEGPLDMRMGPSGMSAAEVVNEWPEADLVRILRRYGEERHAGRVARAIVARRPITTTTELADVVAGAYPATTRHRPHPARRTFQAVRIAVNDELDALRSGLDGAIDLLRPGGRIVVISYHSLEDRIVKRRFVAGATGCTCPPDFPVCVCDASAELRLVPRKAIRPTEQEVERNRRARSARLRIAEKR